MRLAGKVRIVAPTDKTHSALRNYLRTLKNVAVGTRIRARMVQLGRQHLSKRASSASRRKSKRRTFELDAGESKIVEVALLERQGCLIEAVGDTTLSPAQRRNAASELLLIATLLGSSETVQ